MSRIENNQTARAAALWAVSNIENSSRIDAPQGRGYNDGEHNKTAATHEEA
jgi:aminopeptidase N